MLSCCRFNPTLKGILMRKIISLTTFFSFVLLFVTSVVLYVTPHGRVAYWSNWQLWGLSKTQWGALHTNLGVLFTVVGVWHLVLNWSAIVSYLSRRQQALCSSAMVWSFVITVVVSVGTLVDVMPFSGVQVLGERIKDRASMVYGEPPYGHAELSSLKVLVRHTGLELDDVVERLNTAKITFDSPEQSVLDIAIRNNMSPQQLFELIKPAPVAGEVLVLPELPIPGIGRLTLGEICLKYGLDCQAVINELSVPQPNGEVFATPEISLKKLAEKQGVNPMSLYEKIYQLSQAQ